MALKSFETLLAMGTPPGTTPDPRAQNLTLVVTMLVMGVMFYFLLIRPQQKRAKDQAQLLKNIKPGDRVVTASGIVGIIITVKEKTVTLRSADTKLEVTKSAVAEITERGGDSNES